MEDKKKTSQYIEAWNKAKRIMDDYEAGKIPYKQALQQAAEALKDIPPGIVIMPRHIGWPKIRRSEWTK